MKPRYELLQRGTTFTQFGPSPERLVSKHTTLRAGEKAFNESFGHRVLVEVSNGRRTVLQQALI